MPTAMLYRCVNEAISLGPIAVKNKLKPIFSSDADTHHSWLSLVFLSEKVHVAKPLSLVFDHYYQPVLSN